MARINIPTKNLRSPLNSANAKALQAKLADHDSALDALPNGKTVDSGASGGALEVFTFNIADAATADYDITIDHAIEVVDVVVQKRAGAGGAANTVQVKSTAATISDAININIADTTLARAATIDDTNSSIVSGGKLRATVTKAGGNAACLVTVYALRR